MIVELDGMLWAPVPGTTVTAEELAEARSVMLEVHRSLWWNPWVLTDRAAEYHAALEACGQWAAQSRAPSARRPRKTRRSSPCRRALGGRVHPLRRLIAAPGETRIRALVHAVSAEVLDEVLGSWLRDLAAAGRLDGLLTAIAIDGKWLRGVADGQVKLFAAMLQEQKAVTGQCRIPDDITGTTQVRSCWTPWTCGTLWLLPTQRTRSARPRSTSTGPRKKAAGRPITSCTSRETSRPCSGRPSTRSRQAGPATLTGRSWTRSHGRAVRRSLWVTDAAGTGFPQARQVARIRRDHYDSDGQLISREIIHALTSLPARKAAPVALAGIARGQWGIESVHWIRDTAFTEDAGTGYAGNGPQVMATLRNLAISLLYLNGVKEITRTLRAITRDRNRMLDYLPL